MSLTLAERKAKADLLGGGFERRVGDAIGVELREQSDGRILFTGWASVTEHPYTVGDFEETIARDAFKRTLSENPDVQLLVNHAGMPLARTRSGTMRLSEDQRGLRVEADLNPDDPDVKALVPKMRRKDLDGMSFAFKTTQQQWNEDYTKRRIIAVGLHKGDVSVVNQGANPAAAGELRAREEAAIEWAREVRESNRRLASQRERLALLRRGA
jgi:HK97 family phage prohead protease